jgi:serine/threonine protein kinase
MAESTETTRGLEYLKNIIESGKILKLSEARAINQGFSYLFTVTGFTKSWDFSLSREQINDLPGTKNLHAPALALAKGLEFRFRNIDPNCFITYGGQLIHLDIEWPALPLMNSDGTGYVAASGIWVRLKDQVAGTISKCLVSMTSLQTMPGMGLDPFTRISAIINTVRSGVETGTIKFYKQEDLPRGFQPIDLKLGGYLEGSISVQHFLLQKIWLLAFKAGKRDTRAWVSDPWDASYLGCSISEFNQSAAVLDAQEKIVLDDEGEFASVGKALLAQEGPQSPQNLVAVPQFKTALGSYTLGAQLGEGGSGKVFRATDDDGVHHALKYLKPESLSSSKTKRFRNEMAFCSSNTHPNIITVTDRGLAVVNGVEVPFYVMPVFPKTLRSLMDTKIGTDRLLEVFGQVLEGVEAAHSAGIWHRDLKPQNVLVDSAGGQAVVTDFGIAHFTEDLLHTMIETRNSDRLANFRYAAPEQRSNGAIDQRADIYALGLILYEMLTGDLLQGTQHRQIASVHPELAHLDDIVEKMTRQRPEDRPQSIAEFKGVFFKERETVSISIPASAASLSPAKKTPIASSPRVTGKTVVHARYETKGPDAVRANTLVRDSGKSDGWYYYEDSFGENHRESEEDVAKRFLLKDRELIRKGYVRMEYGNLSGKRSFDL